MTDHCFYFGCWNGPGHFLVGPGGQRGVREFGHLEYFADRVHLDSTLAPRLMKRTGDLVWIAMSGNQEERQRRCYDSNECPQGQFLRHELNTGYTAIQWWDRTQGDTRGNCNSTILLQGRHSSEEMLAALETHFPTVLAHLNQAGIQLIDLTPQLDSPTKETP